MVNLPALSAQSLERNDPFLLGDAQRFEVASSRATAFANAAQRSLAR